MVHLDDSDGGMGSLLLFVQLGSGEQLDDALRARINQQLRQRLSPRHTPDEVFAIPEVPYKLTNKKLEVPVKRLLTGAPRDTVVSDGAVRNPHALDIFEELSPRLTANS